MPAARPTPATGPTAATRPTPSGPAARARRRTVPFYVGGWVMVAAVAVACVFLGRWQWHRHETRSAANRVTLANYDAAPTPLLQVLTPTALAVPDAAARPELSWKVVSVQGTYDPAATVLVRGRVEDGSGAYHVMVPLVLGDGTALWVDRGWVIMPDDAGAPQSIPAPPTGQVTVTGHLRPGERESRRVAPAGQVFSITPALLSQVGAARTPTVEPYYLETISEAPAPAQQLGGFQRPEVDDGPHLSYALQWWFFALAAPVVAAVVLRRTGATRGTAPVPVRRESQPAGRPTIPPTVGTAWSRVWHVSDGKDEAAEDAEASASGR